MTLIETVERSSKHPTSSGVGKSQLVDPASVSRTALIYLPVLHSPREIGPIVDQLILLKWTVLIAVGTEGIEQEIQRWVGMGVQLIHPPEEMIYKKTKNKLHGKASTRKPNNVWRLARSILPSSVVRSVSAWRQSKEIDRVHQYARATIEKTRPDIFISPNYHSCGRLDGALVVACSRAKIPSVCILVSPYVGKAIARRGRLTQANAGMVDHTQHANHDLFSRVLAFLYPEWTVGVGLNRIFMWAPELMLAAKLKDDLPADVFQVPSESFDLVVAYNKFSQHLLKRSGFPMEKVISFNPIRLDEAINLVQNSAARVELYDSIDLPLNTSFIIWNIEPSFEHHYCEESLHWARIKQMAQSFSHAGVPIVVSLHPLCDLDSYKFLEKTFGLRLPDKGIHLLLPFCAFVVSFGCSTNQLATSFGKRILMYDWFGIENDAHRWELYRQPEMKVAQNIDQFNAILSEWVDDFNWAASFSAEDMPIPSAPLVAAAISDLARNSAVFQ